ncbi:MAG: hypothetical protein ACI4V1_02140 [Eubacteriales bacterium]
MINKSMIDKMLEMPDDKLLLMLKVVMSGAGLEMSGKNMSKVDEKTLRKIRAVLAEVTDADIERVTYLAELYKNGG